MALKLDVYQSEDYLDFLNYAPQVIRTQGEKFFTEYWDIDEQSIKSTFIDSIY